MLCGCFRENPGFLPPSRTGTKTLGALFPSVSPPQHLSQAFRSHSHVQLGWWSCSRDAQSSPGLHWRSCLPRDGCCSDPSPACALSLPGGLRDGGTVPGEDKSPPNPQIPTKPCLSFYTLRGWRGLHLINHSFWDNTGLPQPSDSPPSGGAQALAFLWVPCPSSPWESVPHSRIVTC